jgi:hypothetical protein
MGYNLLFGSFVLLLKVVGNTQLGGEPHFQFTSWL